MPRSVYPSKYPLVQWNFAETKTFISKLHTICTSATLLPTHPTPLYLLVPHLPDQSVLTESEGLKYVETIQINWQLTTFAYVWHVNGIPWKKESAELRKHTLQFCLRILTRLKVLLTQPFDMSNPFCKQSTGVLNAAQLNKLRYLEILAPLS